MTRRLRAPRSSLQSSLAFVRASQANICYAHVPGDPVTSIASQEIEAALDGSLAVLKPAGRLAVISFHSLEDTLVKRFMQRHSQEDPVYAGLPEVPAHARPKLRRIGKAIHASEAEIERNPRSRSAIMRVAARIAA
jgi:16S rRNA C1402 N4-methylase RsmH